jgi:hypothetical protein
MSCGGQHPEHAVVDGHDGRGGDQDSPVAVKSQQREHAKNLEVILDPAARDVDEQGRKQLCPVGAKIGRLDENHRGFDLSARLSHQSPQLFDTRVRAWTMRMNGHHEADCVVATYNAALSGPQCGRRSGYPGCQGITPELSHADGNRDYPRDPG